MIYETKVKALGDMVDQFEDEAMFITFGEGAPDTLKDFCYIVDVNPVKGEIAPGQKVVIDGTECKITAVGEIAGRNLENLGHVTFVFSGAAEAELSGSICLEEMPVPKLKVGTVIQIKE